MMLQTARQEEDRTSDLSYRWRMASIVFGIFTSCLSGLVLCFLREPSCLTTRSENMGLGAVAEEARHLVRFLKIPTFCIMIIQGIFGTVPWIVMSNYMPLYFKFLRLRDWEVSLISAMLHVAMIFGNILGGLFADALTLQFGCCGRPLTAQITVVLGIPLTDLIFNSLPVNGTSFETYICLIATFGLLASWAQSGTNFPVLSHIAPPSSRSRVMAWEMAFENSVAAAMGSFLLPHLAAKFGLELYSGVTEDTSRDCIPWVVTFLVYSLMHWTYPHDVGVEQAFIP